MHVTAIIAAGGRGERFGGAEPKQLLLVGGTPILARSVEAFTSHPSVDAVIVALPQALADDPPAYLRSARAFARRREEAETPGLAPGRRCGSWLAARGGRTPWPTRSKRRGKSPTSSRFTTRRVRSRPRS